MSIGGYVNAKFHVTSEGFPSRHFPGSLSGVFLLACNRTSSSALGNPRFICNILVTPRSDRISESGVENLQTKGLRKECCRLSALIVLREHSRKRRVNSFFPHSIFVIANFKELTRSGLEASSASMIHGSARMHLCDVDESALI